MKPRFYLTLVLAFSPVACAKHYHVSPQDVATATSQDIADTKAALEFYNSQQIAHIVPASEKTETLLVQAETGMNAANPDSALSKKDMPSLCKAYVAANDARWFLFDQMARIGMPSSSYPELTQKIIAADSGLTVLDTDCGRKLTDMAPSYYFQ